MRIVSLWSLGNFHPDCWKSQDTIPFGEDDDDFESHDLLDRHFRGALAMVDDTEDPPVLQRDVFRDVQEAALVSTIIK